MPRFSFLRRKVFVNFHFWLLKPYQRLMLSIFLAGLLAGSRMSAQISGAQVHIATNSQTGASYTVQSSDCGKLVSLSNNNPITVTVPQSGSAGGLSTGCWIDIQNTGSGPATLTTTGSLIDGAASVVLTTNQGLRLFSDHNSFYTQRGQGSGNGSGGALTVQSDGSAIGTSGTLNLVAGTGVACIPQMITGMINVQCNADTSYLASKPTLQSDANPQICVSSSDSGTAYTAACGNTLAAYAARQTLFWYSDVSNSVSEATLNIDTLGAKSLVRMDGTALAPGDIKAASLYRIWYDGAMFHVVEAGLASGGVSNTTSGSTSSRGSFASRSSCGTNQTGNVYFSTDIPHQSQCDGTSWADYINGQPVKLPDATSFSTLNGTGYTITSNGIMTISGPSSSTTNIVGQEIPVPAAPWTVIAWLAPIQSEGFVGGGQAAGRVLYVRDAANKLIGIYDYPFLYYTATTYWNHWPSATSAAASSAILTSGTSAPFLRIHYDGSTYTYSGCTTYNAATMGGAFNFGGGNCEAYGSEAGDAYLGAPVAVGWGLDTDQTGSNRIALTILSWQVTN
jgi:hypothetical protein